MFCRDPVPFLSTFVAMSMAKTAACVQNITISCTVICHIIDVLQSGY